jgi:hypothetical protein
MASLPVATALTDAGARAVTGWFTAKCARGCTPSALVHASASENAPLMALDTALHARVRAGRRVARVALDVLESEHGIFIVSEQAAAAPALLRSQAFQAAMLRRVAPDAIAIAKALFLDAAEALHAADEAAERAAAAAHVIAAPTPPPGLVRSSADSPGGDGGASTVPPRDTHAAAAVPAALRVRLTQLALRHQAAAPHLFFVACCLLLCVPFVLPRRLLHPLLATLSPPTAGPALSAAGSWDLQLGLNLAVAALAAACMLAERVMQWRKHRRATARLRQQHEAEKER